MKTGILITRAQLERDYKILQEGKYNNVKVATGSARPWVNPNLKNASSTYVHSHLINLKAIDVRNVDRVKEAFGDNNAIDLGDLNGMLFVHEIIVNVNPDTGEMNTPELPSRGELVTISLENAKTKDGELVKDLSDRNILNVSSFKVNQAEKAVSFAFDSVKFDEQDEEEDEEEVEEEVVKKSIASKKKAKA